MTNKEMKKETWLNANKISLSINKTEVDLLKSLNKQTYCDLHLKLNKKQLYPYRCSEIF